MRAIVAWQELITIPEHSNFGWWVVDVYELDRLAWGDEDVKSADKAEKVVDQKS